ALDFNTDSPASLDRHLAFRVHVRTFALGAAQGSLLDTVDGLLHLERAIAAHVRQRVDTFRLGCFRQTRYALEDESVVLVDRDLLTRTIGALEVPADAKIALVVHLPGELDPELVLFPDLTGVGFVSELHRPAVALARDPIDRLAKRDPHAAMRLVTVQVMALRRMAHRQHQVGPVGGFVPGGR